jgi:hypothetical protein
LFVVLGSSQAVHITEVTVCRNIIGSVVLATILYAAVTLAAQTTKSATSQATPVVRITVTGCLQPSERSATGNNRTGDTKYVLNHAKPDKSVSKDRAGTTGKTSESEAATTYRLDASDTTLSPHVGHQVEIVAVVEEPDSSSPAGTSGSTNSPKLKVETVKMIAMTCPS